MVDDKENNPSQELIAKFRIYGTSKGETGSNSPVKKKYHRKVRKQVRDPKNWVKNKRKRLRNTGQTYTYWCPKQKKT